MGDGWETRRRRAPGHDWAIVRLGAAGVISRIEIDTNHFKGNYPESASIEACLAPGATLEDLGRARWVELLARTKLEAHHRHFFARELQKTGPVSHVRLNIFPDGGVSRFRVHGILATP
jgi:allantoicase